jgi:hypothetical protein
MDVGGDAAGEFGAEGGEFGVWRVVHGGCPYEITVARIEASMSEKFGTRQE